MKGRRVRGLVVAGAITLLLTTTLCVSRLLAQQDFTQSQNPAPAQQTAGTAAPDLLPPQNPTPSAGPNPGEAAPQNPAPAGDVSAPEQQAANDPNTEVLTKGPVHEAFATPVVFNPTPSAVVPKQPPEPVEEMPPEQKPAGDHVVWIAGYWTYETDQQKFIWTSGIWRAMPQGVEWVPGYWNPADGGSQWVAGFWRKDTAETQVNYLPQQPPNTLEQGPVGAAPSADYVWVPGHWVWWHEHYAWRPGFWAAANPNWIWVPANYAWTPNGYVFIDGHWDYAMEQRGVFFAPVVFRPGVFIGPGFVYSPVVAMDFGVCTGCLFCRPGCYCFGDYYGPAFVGVGIYPWFAWHGRYGYDPCFAYYGWRYHGDPGWRDRLVVDYRFRIGNPGARPPHTYAAMIRVGGPALPCTSTSTRDAEAGCGSSGSAGPGGPRSTGKCGSSTWPTRDARRPSGARPVRGLTPRKFTSRRSRPPTALGRRARIRRRVSRRSRRPPRSSQRGPTRDSRRGPRPASRATIAVNSAKKR